MTLLPTLMLALTAAPAEASDVNRYALLVGANDGGQGRQVLRYAHADAMGMSDILTELGGVDAANRTLLLDPTAETLERALLGIEDLVRKDSGRSEVFFYYSGHSDEEGLMLGDDHFPYTTLRQDLESLSADVRVAILDSCASGAMVRTKGGRRVAPFMLDESNRLDGFAIITSSAADEVAQEADRIGGSYFTYYLRSGLRGAADMSQDGRVTLDEAYAFAHSETLARTQSSQHGPQHANRGGGLDGQGQLVLTDLKLTTASLVLAADLDGRALIRDDDHQLVAELLKPGGRAVELGLGAGEYDVVFTVPGQDRYAVANVQLARGQSTLLRASDLVWFDSEQATARGGDEVPQASLVAVSETRRIGLRFQLVPGVGPTPPNSVDTTLIGLGAAHAKQVEGLAIALGGVVVDRQTRGMALSIGGNTTGELDGSQLSVGVNVAGRDARGFQGTVGANVVGGQLDGIQASVGGNVVGRKAQGAQLSVGANTTGGRMDGWQAAAGANIVGGHMRGAQTSAGVNLATSVEGLQATAGINLAGDVKGLQASSVNVARDVKGAQVGILNIGRDVKGGQIGIINVARDVDGLSLGLLSFEKEGRHDLLVYTTETDTVNLDFKLGGDHLHTIFAAGIRPDQWGWVGLGYGGHANLGRLWLDIDALWQSYTPLASFTQSVDGQPRLFEPFRGQPTQVARGRVTLGAQLAKQLAIFGGVQMSVRVPITTNQLDIVPTYLADPSEEILAWPGAFAGIQF